MLLIYQDAESTSHILLHCIVAWVLFFISLGFLDFALFVLALLVREFWKVESYACLLHLEIMEGSLKG